MEVTLANISKRITLSAIQSLKPNQTIRDTEIKGFGARKRNDTASYFLQTRINGRLRWITIGRHGSPWTPTTAKQEALKLLTDVARGIDPTLERYKQKTIPTVKIASKQFLEDHCPKLSPATNENYHHFIKNYIKPELGKYKVNELDKTIISKVHNKWGGKPRTANYSLAVLSKFMSWCEEQGWRPENSNPWRRIKKDRERKGERYLTLEELKRLGEILNEAEATGSENVYVIAAIRLLIFTGARLNEILSLTWDEVDIGNGFLFLKTSKTGQKPIFLNESAKNILSSIPRLSKNPYVIVGNKTGQHLVNLRKPWCGIRKKAGIEDVRLHDLRHSFASLTAANGASLEFIGALLGHSNPQTTARYAHLANHPLREVNEKVGSQLSEVLKL